MSDPPNASSRRGLVVAVVSLVLAAVTILFLLLRHPGVRDWLTTRALRKNPDTLFELIEQGDWSMARLEAAMGREAAKQFVTDRWFAALREENSAAYDFIRSPLSGRKDREFLAYVEWVGRFLSVSAGAWHAGQRPSNPGMLKEMRLARFEYPGTLPTRWRALGEWLSSGTPTVFEVTHDRVEGRCAVLLGVHLRPRARCRRVRLLAGSSDAEIVQWFVPRWRERAPGGTNEHRQQPGVSTRNDSSSGSNRQWNSSQIRCGSGAIPTTTSSPRFFERRMPPRSHLEPSLRTIGDETPEGRNSSSMQGISWHEWPCSPMRGHRPYRTGSRPSSFSTFEQRDETMSATTMSVKTRLYPLTFLWPLVSFLVVPPAAVAAPGKDTDAPEPADVSELLEARSQEASSARARRRHRRRQARDRDRRDGHSHRRREAASHGGRSLAHRLLREGDDRDAHSASRRKAQADLEGHGRTGLPSASAEHAPGVS